MVNRKATIADVERCRSIIAAIKAATLSADDEQRWISPGGQRVHGDLSTADFDHIDCAFLDALRLQSYMFSGWHLANLRAHRPVWCWVDDLAKRFDSDDGSHWSIAAFERLVHGLPTEYVCNPPLVAGEMGFNVSGICVNPDTVAYQERMVALFRSGLLERLRPGNGATVIEIGGGYGALAYFIKRMLPGARYFIVDIPTSLMFAGCYLALADPGRSIGVLPGMASSLDYCLVPASSLHAARIGPIDLAINTLSFQEMPSETVAGYAHDLAEALAPDGTLFEQNFVNSHLNPASFCNPRPALDRWLRFERTLEGEYLWGQPNLWRAKRARWYGMLRTVFRLAADVVR